MCRPVLQLPAAWQPAPFRLNNAQDDLFRTSVAAARFPDPNLWNRLKSIIDRASDVKSRSLAHSQDFELLAIAVLREAEYADLIEQAWKLNERTCAAN